MYLFRFLVSRYLLFICRETPFHHFASYLIRRSMKKFPQAYQEIQNDKYTEITVCCQEKI